jgi:hypothetical protein
VIHRVSSQLADFLRPAPIPASSNITYEARGSYVCDAAGLRKALSAPLAQDLRYAMVAEWNKSDGYTHLVGPCLSRRDANLPCRL